MSDDLRDDEETRAELHQQVDDLRERLWNICDERKEQAEKERTGQCGHPDHITAAKIWDFQQKLLFDVFCKQILEVSSQEGDWKTLNTGCFAQLISFCGTLRRQMLQARKSTLVNIRSN